MNLFLKIISLLNLSHFSQISCPIYLSQSQKIRCRRSTHWLLTTYKRTQKDTNLSFSFITKKPDKHLIRPPFHSIHWRRRRICWDIRFLVFHRPPTRGLLFMLQEFVSLSSSLSQVNWTWLVTLAKNSKFIIYVWWALIIFFTTCAPSSTYDLLFRG